MEAFPPGRRDIRGSRRIDKFDLDNDHTFARLLSEIVSGYVGFLHFGIPCSPWGRANTLNQGTRTLDEPLGNQSVARELLGNQQASRMSRLCLAAHHVGCRFSFENPFDSFLFKAPCIVELMSACNCYSVCFDQCAYALQLPGSRQHDYCKKRTRIASNFDMSSLALACPAVSALHQHVHAWGSKKVNGVWVSLASAAGRYPPSLCQAIVSSLQADCLLLGRRQL
jgi:hypothetical protein